MGNLALIGPSNAGVTTKVESQRSINWYPVKAEREGERPHLRGRPGLQLLCILDFTDIRGAMDYNGRFFCLNRTSIFEVYADGSRRFWGNIASTEGPVTMAALLNIIVIGDGSKFYALDVNTGTVSVITNAPRGRFCRFFNQRIVYQGPGGQIYYSELNDATNIDPDTNFFTAESLPDEIVAITTSEDKLFLHGSASVECWYDSGDSDNPFQRVPGGIVYSGTGYPDTALAFDNAVWWVEKDAYGSGIVRRLVQGTPVRVSTSAVERALKGAGNITAHCYQEEGHSFYVLNADGFANSIDGITWVYDVKTNEWHERAWQNPLTGLQQRARPEHHVYALGGHIVTDHQNGQIYRQSLDYHDDFGMPIRRTRVSAHSDQSGKAMIIDELFLDFATGVGLDGEQQGTDPQVMLRVSKDGTSWGRERTAYLGRIGQFGRRVRFQRLGMGRDWLFEISVSDPVLSALMGGDVKARVGTR